MKGSCSLVASVFAASTVALTSSSSSGGRDGAFFPGCKEVSLRIFYCFSSGFWFPTRPLNKDLCYRFHVFLRMLVSDSDIGGCCLI